MAVAFLLPAGKDYFTTPGQFLFWPVFNIQMLIPEGVAQT